MTDLVPELAPRATVLVVDDDCAYLRSAKRLLRLRRPDLVIRGFESGEQALGFLASERAALAILDYNLPGINGVELCGMIRAQEDPPPVVLVSGRLDDDVRREARNAGAIRAFQKPFDLRAIIEAGERAAYVGTSQLLSMEQVEMARTIARALARRYGRLLAPEDITGFALVGLCEAANRYDAMTDGPFFAFAARRIRGAVLDELRRLESRRRESLGVDDDETESIAGTEPPVDIALDRMLLHHRIAEARKSLPPRDFEIVRLRFDEGWNLAAIGQHLGISETRVSAVLSACILRLGTRLEAETAAATAR